MPRNSNVVTLVEDANPFLWHSNLVARLPLGDVLLSTGTRANTAVRSRQRKHECPRGRQLLPVKDMMDVGRSIEGPVLSSQIQIGRTQ